MNKLWRGEEREIFYFQIFCNFPLFFAFFHFFFVGGSARCLSLFFVSLSLFSLFSFLFFFAFLMRCPLLCVGRRHTTSHFLFCARGIFIIRTSSSRLLFTRLNTNEVEEILRQSAARPSFAFPLSLSRVSFSLWVGKKRRTR